MTGKLIFLVLLAALMLVNVQGEDDFKEVDNVEEEVEDMDPKNQDDEPSGAKQPRAFRFRGGSSRTRFGTRTGTSTRTGGFFSRRSTRSGGTSGGTGSRIFRRSGGSSGGTRTGGGTRIFRRTRTGTRSGSSGTNGGTGTWDKIGAVLDLAQLGTDLATTTLDTLSGIERKIVIALGNLEGVDWQGGTSDMNEGSSVKALPLEVATEEGIQMAGVKDAGPSTTGVSGALCYRFQLISKSFCLMYKVPYTGDNYWNLKVYDGAKQASAEIYNDLQDGAIKAGNPVARKELGEGDGYKIYMKDCSMTNSGQSVLQVYVGIES